MNTNYKLTRLVFALCSEKLHPSGDFEDIHEGTDVSS